MSALIYGGKTLNLNFFWSDLMVDLTPERI